MSAFEEFQEDRVFRAIAKILLASGWPEYRIALLWMSLSPDNQTGAK
jgi:hypothetical protein